MNNKTTITKWFSMLLLMLVAGVSGAVAQSLTISNFAIAAGETKDVAITLTPASGQTIYGVQTDVVLSEGLTLTGATKADADLNFSWNDANNRLILLSTNSSEQKAIAEGDIITLSITAADDFEGGTVTLSNSRLTTDIVGNESKVSNCEATVTLDAPFEPVDWTAKVLTDGWQSNMAGNVGTYTKDVEQAEHYNGSTTELLDDVLYQMVGDLPNGTYTVELYANASYTPGRGFDSEALDGELGRVIVYAFEPDGCSVIKTIPVIHQTDVSENNIVTLENVVVTNGSLILGLAKIAPGSNWHTIQIKSLTQTSNEAEADETAQDAYWKDIAATIAAYEAYEVVDGDERTALTSVATMTDAITAIPSFYAVKEHYDLMAAAKEALDAMKAMMGGTNVYTAEAFETYNGIYTTNLAKYEAGTLTDDEAKAIVNPSKAIDWSVRSQEKYGDAPTFLLSSWEPTFPDFSTYYINTWSVEGENDGSEFKVPFFEYFTGAEASLAEKTLTATVEDLENGLYKVTAWVRVETKNGEAATAATGVTLAVNDGEEADVTEGTQIGETLRSLGTFEAQGLVKDGTLNIKFNVASDNNIHWLSFKNVNYEKVRDLTEEEMAVKPTSVTFDEETITLTATSNTLTLTPSYTPDEATATFNWTSSDESVATVTNEGVVTGVAPGTATITVTSTLDEDVWATCEVTVSYPETEYELSNYTNDGATRSINTLSENNLVKNGSFEYPDGFYGWTDATAGAKKLSSSNFEIVTDGDNHYLKAKSHGGSTDAKSIGTAWPIEAGKTYVFGYKVKSSSNGNSEYHKVSLTNTPGTETKQISVNSTAVGTGWTDVNYTFTNTENYAYIQLRARWLNSAVCFDDVYLAEATYSLVGNVDYATAAIPTSNIGTGAFQYSQDAIDAANALEQDKATVEDVENAYDALTTLNAPEEGQLFNVVNVTDGFTHKGKALTFMSSIDADLTASTTSIGWLEAPGSIHPQAIKFTPVEGVKNGYTMSYTRADGNVVYVSTGKTSGLGSNTQQIRPTIDATKALTFVVNSTGDNTWTLFNTEDQHSVGSNGDTGFFTAGGSNKDVTIQEAVNNEFNLVVEAANQYATLIVPFDAAVPTDIAVYSVNKANNNELDLQTVTELKANTPYVVFAGDGITTTLAGLGAAFTENSYTVGWLTGVYAETAVPIGSYVLQNHEGSVAFYVVDPDVAVPNVQANHAYMTIPNGDGARAYYFGGEATAISTLKALTSGDAEIYDVNGRKQVKLQKGVNIIRTKDGQTRKVMVK